VHANTTVLISEHVKCVEKGHIILQFIFL